MIITSKVPANFRNLSLIDYLSKRFTYLSREEWLLRIGEDRVKINDIVSDKNRIVATDDSLAYDMPDFKEPDADLNYKIVYEDDWILGINKPGNLLVHHQGHNFKSNLIYQLRYVHDPLYPDTDIINRLDRETSGLVLVSKSKDALKAFNKLFKEHRIEKEYLAVVHGDLGSLEGNIDTPLGKDKDARIKSKHKVDKVNGKDAYTHYEVVEKVRNFSILKLLPKTGRTHQLRVHLQSIGHPIVGDKFYSVDEDTFYKYIKEKDMHEEIFGMKRQALHCCGLEFVHPFTGALFKLRADIPEDIKELIN